MKTKFLQEFRELDERLITENRLILEGKVVGCLWSNPDLYNEYKDLVSESFITEDGRYYYSLGKKMSKKGYEVFDEITVLTYIQENDILKSNFEKKGGFSNIKTVISSVNTKNLHTYIDEVFKANIIIDLHNEGFNLFNEILVTEGEKSKKVIPFEMFKNMSSTQVSEWYDWRLQSITMDKAMGNTKIVYLDLDDDFINSCDRGENMGLPYDVIGEEIEGKLIYGCPILNSSTLGIHKGDVELIGAFSGCGKSSYILANRVMPVIYHSEKICIMANEMDINRYKAIILPMILAYHFRYFGLPRQSLKKGKFTEEQWVMIRKAQTYYREHYNNKIAFVDIDNYDMSVAKTTIRRLSRQGVNYYIYDTFKAGNMESSNTRGQLIESSKTMYQLAKKYDVAITIVMQLAIHMENVRYVTSACLSEAKGVKEVISEMVLFRKLWEDEYDGEKYDVKPYRFIKDKQTGKYLKAKEYIQLDKDKIYRIFFLDKTRNDSDGKCVLYQFDGSWNKWKEIAYCTPSHIDARGK